MIENYSDNKKENKKERAKDCYQTNKQNKTTKKITRLLKKSFRRKKTKKEIIPTWKIKTCQTQIEKEGKIYEKLLLQKKFCRMIYLIMLKNLEISKVKHIKIICRCRCFKKASWIYFEIGRTWKLSTQKSKIKIFFRFLKIFEMWKASKKRKSVLKTKKNS